jgi:hypothetical protein
MSCSAAEAGVRAQMLARTRRHRRTRYDDGIKRRHQLRDVIAVSCGHDDRQRDATGAPKHRDPRVAQRLRSELAGILNWTLAGCRAWLLDRLDPPNAVVNAVAEYRDDMDLIGQWISQACEIGTELEVQANAAYLSYRAWAEEAGSQTFNGSKGVVVSGAKPRTTAMIRH